MKTLFASPSIKPAVQLRNTFPTEAQPRGCGTPAQAATSSAFIAVFVLSSVTIIAHNFFTVKITRVFFDMLGFWNT